MMMATDPRLASRRFNYRPFSPSENMDNLASQWLGYEFHAASLVGNSMKQSKFEFELNLFESMCVCVRDREIRLSVIWSRIFRARKKNGCGNPRGLNPNRELGAVGERKDCFLLKM